MVPLKSFDGKIGRLITGAKLTLYWERVWPLLFALLLILISYCAVSWLGLWLLMPAFLKLGVLFIFFLAALYLISRILRTSFPTINDAIIFIDASSSTQHRPLSALFDEPAFLEGETNSFQEKLWHAHKQRTSQSVHLLKSKWPEAQMQRVDRYGFRALIVLVAAIGFLYAGPEKAMRLLDAFSFSISQKTVPVRLDAWVTPPKYTGKAPLFLTRDLSENEKQNVLTVPQGSVVTIRLINGENSSLVFKSHNGQGVFKEPEKADTTSNHIASQFNYSHVLDEAGTLTIRHDKGGKAWSFAVVEDLPPKVSLIQDPEIQRSGAMEILARIQDDYGVDKAKVLFFSDDKKASGKEKSSPLYEAPSFALRLRYGKVRDGVSKTLHSLTEHPWAGGRVLMQLKAYDEAGQEGLSEIHAFTLPSRPFYKPLAQALLEQRRLLALDAGYADNLVDVIDVLTLWPEQFESELAAYISLAAIRRGLLSARNDDDLRKVVDSLWHLALALEEGDVSDAEKALRSALEALREGIRNGASSEEIARLTDDVRKALDQYIQALAEKAQNNDLARNDASPNSRSLDAQDLQEMLNRIQELSETGSRDAAENLLSELQQLMENLQAQSQSGQGEQNSAREMLNELGNMIRKQQGLMDQTFRENQRQENNQSEQGQPEAGKQGKGQNNNQGQPQGLQGLSQGQDQLANRLNEFLKGLGSEEGNSSLSQNGEQGERGRLQLDNAQRSMRGAAGTLQQGDLEGAGQLQSEALNQLRRGAQRLSEQLAGEQSGQRRQGQGRQSNGRDPLGRQNGQTSGDFGDDVDLPNEIDTQRARQILDIIRKRLGDRLRPQEELNYLERLLSK